VVWRTLSYWGYAYPSGCRLNVECESECPDPARRLTSWSDGLNSLGFVQCTLRPSPLPWLLDLSPSFLHSECTTVQGRVR
jgi:hypothetical protein